MDFSPRPDTQAWLRDRGCAAASAYASHAAAMRERKEVQGGEWGETAAAAATTTAGGAVAGGSLRATAFCGPIDSILESELVNEDTEWYYLFRPVCSMMAMALNAIFKNHPECSSGRFVYVIKSPASEAVSIGSTNDLRRRMGQYNVHCADRVMYICVHSCADGYGLEKVLHNTFADKRKDRREWFHLSESDIDMLKTCMTGDIPVPCPRQPRFASNPPDNVQRQLACALNVDCVADGVELGERWSYYLRFGRKYEDPTHEQHKMMHFDALELALREHVSKPNPSSEARATCMEVAKLLKVVLGRSYGLRYRPFGTATSRGPRKAQRRLPRTVRLETCR